MSDDYLPLPTAPYKIVCSKPSNTNGGRYRQETIVCAYETLEHAQGAVERSNSYACEGVYFFIKHEGKRIMSIGQPDGHGGTQPAKFAGEVTPAGDSALLNLHLDATYCVRKYSGHAGQMKERLHFFHLFSDAQAAAETLTSGDADALGDHPTVYYRAENSVA